MSRFGLCTVGADGHAINSFDEGAFATLEEAQAGAHAFIARQTELDASAFDRRLDAVGVRPWDSGVADDASIEGLVSLPTSAGETVRYPEHTLLGIVCLPCWSSEACPEAYEGRDETFRITTFRSERGSARGYACVLHVLDAQGGGWVGFGETREAAAAAACADMQHDLRLVCRHAVAISALGAS